MSLVIDVSDNGSPDVKEDAGRIMSDLKIRHRRTAADKKPPPYCPPKSFSVPGNADNAPAVHDCYKEAKTYTEEASQSPESDTQMDVKGDHQGGLKDDGIMDAEEDHDSCVTAGLVYDESHKEEEKVIFCSLALTCYLIYNSFTCMRVSSKTVWTAAKSKIDTLEC